MRGGLVCRVALCVVAAGCSQPAGDGAREANHTGTSTNCPKLSAPPAGQCRSDDDCSGEWMECAWGPPRPGPRVTGSGVLFGTDDVRCEHGYQPAESCPDGQAVRIRPAANLCPVPECVPRCTDDSCAAGELCDHGSGLCRPIACTETWTCAADEICKHGPNADEHGCAPACPGYGRCVKYGPPMP